MAEFHINSDTRFTIIGQGLAGSLTACLLVQAGRNVRVFDTLLPGAATCVAPGIVNPLPGRKFNTVTDAHQLLQLTIKTFSQLATFLNAPSPLWHPLPVLRVIDDDAQLLAFERARSLSSVSSFISREFPANAFDHLFAEFGSFQTEPAGWVDLPAFQAAARDFLRSNGLLHEIELSSVLQPQANECVIHCQGWQVRNVPLWDFIPMNPAKGEMLTGHFPKEMPRSHIINRRCWLQPLPADRWRVGATYTWDDLGSLPSLDAATNLQDSIRQLTPLRFTPEEQVAGVRPITQDILPVIGPHPDFPQHWIFNGLGSKGALQAPALAHALVDALIHQKPLPENFSPGRFRL